MRRTARLAAEVLSYVAVTAIGAAVDWQVRHWFDRRAAERHEAERRQAKKKQRKKQKRP